MYRSVQTFKFRAFSQEGLQIFLFGHTAAVSHGKPKNFHEHLLLKEEHESRSNKNSCEKDIQYD